MAKVFDRNRVKTRAIGKLRIEFFNVYHRRLVRTACCTGAIIGISFYMVGPRCQGVRCQALGSDQDVIGIFLGKIAKLNGAGKYGCFDGRGTKHNKMPGLVRRG